MARFVLGGLLIGWLADWWLGERQTELRSRGLLGPMRSSVMIHAPIERVWDELVDIPGQLRWMSDMKSVSVLTPGPIDLGTRAHATVRVLGISMPDPVEISVWQPPERFGVRHIGPWRGEGLITLTPVGEDLTRVDWEEVLVPPVFPNLGDLIQHWILGPIFQDDLANLKALIESGQPG